MSTTPTANTLLPPAVRVAKLLGVVGSAYAAGAYLTTSAHTLPSLSTSSARDLALTLSSLRTRLSKPLLFVTSASSTAFAYIAYYLYSTPDLIIPVTSVQFSADSFLPHADLTAVVVGGGWKIYAVAAGVLAAVVPWQLLGVSQVERRIVAAGEGVSAAEGTGLQTEVVDGESMGAESQKWARGWGVSGALAALGAVVGAYGSAWW